MSDVQIPAQLDYMLKALLDTKDNVWQRQAYQARLIAIRDKIDDVLRRFEVEYKKASTDVNKKPGKSKIDKETKSKLALSRVGAGNV